MEQMSSCTPCVTSIALKHPGGEFFERENDYIIEMHGIQKSFGGVKALRNIDLQVKRGSCHALLGENGAGKSTLMKVLTGIIAKDSGKILLNGEEVQIQSLRHAEELGIAIVPQELSFISYFTVAENIFYGEEPTRPLPLLIDWKSCIPPVMRSSKS